MTRISITINSNDSENPHESQNYTIHFNGDFNTIIEKINKIYEEFSIKDKKEK